MMKLINQSLLDELSRSARQSPRLRQHKNIHDSYQEPCQRLLIAMEPNSYLPPHTHFSDSRIEMFIALRGSLALLTFYPDGKIQDVYKFAPQSEMLAAEVSGDVWHTIIALESGSAFLEIKPGPYDPALGKNNAPWAPEEKSPEAMPYYEYLLDQAKTIL